MGVHKRVTPRAADAADADRVRAWNAFWEEQGPESRCLASASAETRRCLTNHWISFGSRLAPGTNVLDVGCGSGVVGRSLAAAHGHLHVVGIDSAQVPHACRLAGTRILQGVAAESLPFADGVFGAAVSQFGLEYSSIEAAVNEVARVLRRHAPISFIVHHSESAIVRAGRLHNRGLRLIVDDPVRTAFLAGDEAALTEQLEGLRRQHSDDETIRFIARCLTWKVGRESGERRRIWEAAVDALAPERVLLDALESCCVAPDRLNAWLGPLRALFELDRPVALMVQDEPRAWKIDGLRAG